MGRMADAMGEVSDPRAGVDWAALSTLHVALINHAGSISAQVYQDEKPTEGKFLEKKRIKEDLAAESAKITEITSCNGRNPQKHR